MQLGPSDGRKLSFLCWAELPGGAYKLVSSWPWPWAAYTSLRCWVYLTYRCQVMPWLVSCVASLLTVVHASKSLASLHADTTHSRPCLTRTAPFVLLFHMPPLCTCRHFLHIFCSTLTQAASRCGSPIEHGSLYFSTLAYLRQLKSLTCLKQAGDTSEQPYSAVGSYMQGAVETYAVMEGRSGDAAWLESEGSVEYSTSIPAVGTTASQPAQEPYDPQLTWLKEGQMIIRLGVDEYE